MYGRGDCAEIKVFAVVLTYGNHEDTRECLASLMAIDYGCCEIVVVDNGSRDDSVDRLKREFPSLRFISNAVNLGYAGGNNVGVRYALEQGADAVWLLNNDTVVRPDSLTRLIEAASELPDAGILGSVMHCYGAPETVHFAGGRLRRWQGKGLHLESPQGVNASSLEPRATDFCTGASLLARREMIESIGFLDEAYFLYLEDVDWALRARKAGWRAYMVPGSIVLHKVNRTTGKRRPLIIYYVCRNSLYLCRRHFPAYLATVLSWCLFSYVVAYLIKWFLKGSRDDPLEHMKMGWRGIRDFFTRRMGEYRGA